MTEQNEAFFRREGDLLIPNPCAKGPWANAGLHGRVIAGLLARGIERVTGEPYFHPVRAPEIFYL